jgi:hypothetical protein
MESLYFASFCYITANAETHFWHADTKYDEPEKSRFSSREGMKIVLIFSYSRILGSQILKSSILPRIYPHTHALAQITSLERTWGESSAAGK